MPTIKIDAIPDVPFEATAKDLKAVLGELPDFPQEPGPDEKALRAAVADAKTFNALLKKLYPTHASTLFAAGALAKTCAKAGKYAVGQTVLKLDQSVRPPSGHVGVVGDLEVRGDLDLSCALVVTGNLRVEGALSDAGPESRVVVLGNLYCKQLNTSGWLLVGGDLEVAGALCGEYNDDAVEVLGDITAGIILNSDHDISAAGRITVKVTPAEEGAWGDKMFDLSDEGHIKQLRKRLGKKAIDADGELDLDEVRKFEP